MLSVIVCSREPRLQEQLKENIQATIGIPFEYLCHDNRHDNLPIAKVYNSMALKAQYDYLLFIHEDILFHSTNWGGIITQKLSEPDCGVIGFAGAPIMNWCYGSWSTNIRTLDSKNYIQNGKVEHNQHSKDAYDPVVTVDGMTMFVRKDVWQAHPFDEKMLTGFHCYDVDFCLGIGASHKNYVCNTGITLEHFSKGSFSTEWVTTTIRMFESKWCNVLPRLAMPLSTSVQRKSHEGQMFYFTKQCLRSNIDNSVKKKILRQYLDLPLFVSGSVSHLFKVLRLSLRLL